MEDIQISNDGSTNDYKDSKGQKVQKVQLEDIQICNDGVEDIQIGNVISTTAIISYKFK